MGEQKAGKPPAHPIPNKGRAFLRQCWGLAPRLTQALPKHLIMKIFKPTENSELYKKHQHTSI